MRKASANERPQGDADLSVSGSVGTRSAQIEGAATAGSTKHDEPIPETSPHDLEHLRILLLLEDVLAGLILAEKKLAKLGKSSKDRIDEARAIVDRLVVETQKNTDRIWQHTSGALQWALIETIRQKQLAQDDEVPPMQLGIDWGLNKLELQELRKAVGDKRDAHERLHRMMRVMGLVNMAGDFENYEAFYRAELKKYPMVRKKRRSKGEEPPTTDHTDSLTPPSPASIAMYIQEANEAGEKAMLRFCEYLGYRGYDRDPDDSELLDALISEYHETAK